MFNKKCGLLLLTLLLLLLSVGSLMDVQKSFERLTSGDDDAIKILIDPSK